MDGGMLTAAVCYWVFVIKRVTLEFGIRGEQVGGKPPRVKSKSEHFLLFSIPNITWKVIMYTTKELNKRTLTNTQVSALKVTRATLRAAPIHGPHSPPVSRLIADPGKTDRARQLCDVPFLKGRKKEIVPLFSVDMASFKVQGGKIIKMQWNCKHKSQYFGGDFVLFSWTKTINGVI